MGTTITAIEHMAARATASTAMGTDVKTMRTMGANVTAIRLWGLTLLWLGEYALTVER